MIEGWIKLHRKMTEWEWYDDHNTTRLFMHLIFTVNYKSKRWRGVILEPGQRVFGLHKLSDECGLSVRQLRTCLVRLTSTNEITVKATNKFTILTIVKYEEYQSEEKKATNKRQTNDKQTTTTKERKERKERKEKEERITPPRILDKSKLLSPKTEKLSTMERIGCFENNVLEGKGSFNIEHLLTDSDWQKVRCVAKGWDVHKLASIYNDGVMIRGEPKYPTLAFVAWCGKYTKGKEL